MLPSHVASKLVNPFEMPQQLASPQPSTPQPATPQPVVQEPAPVEEQLPIELPSFAEGDNTEPAPVEEPVVEEVTDDVEADLPDSPAAENFKKLREAVKEARTKKKELESKVQEYEQELDKYKTGKVVPDVVAAKDRRIAELEKYEKAVNIKLSPEYQNEFVAPAIALGRQLDEHAESYGISPDLLRQAVEITNPKQLNSFLSKYFDELGALEAKQVINKLQDIGERALQAEQEPENIMEELRAKYKQHEEQEMQRRATILESTAKSAWNKALEKRAKEGVYKEFIADPANPEHNKKVVEPIVSRAAQQYGALITQLAKHGIKELPEDFATNLASLVQFSMGAAMQLSKMKAMETELANIKNTSRIVTPYIRPSITGNVGAGVSSAATQPREMLNPRNASQRAAAALKTS